MRAAAGGIIDFSQANPWDIRWYLKRNLLIDAAEDLWAMEFLKCKLLKHLVFVQSPHVTNSDLLTKQLGRANKILDQLFDLTNCINTAVKQDTVNAAKQARDGWAAAFGDPDDPEVARKIDDVVAQLRAQRALARKN